MYNIVRASDAPNNRLPLLSPHTNNDSGVNKGLRQGQNGDFGTAKSWYFVLGRTWFVLTCPSFHHTP